MKNRQRLTSWADRQQGISLVVALIMLLIMTVIGISAMNTSISKLRMTGGIQQQSIVSNNAEQTLRTGEAAISGLTVLGGGFVDSSDFTGTINSTNAFFNDNTWVTQAVGQPGNEYIIEYLGPRDRDGERILIGSGPIPPGSKKHIYRVTARVTETNGTRRMFQSLFIDASGPN